MIVPSLQHNYGEKDNIKTYQLKFLEGTTEKQQNPNGSPNGNSHQDEKERCLLDRYR